MDLALFDFDHTITDRDSFSAFLRAHVPARRRYWGGLLVAPLLLGYYRLHLVSGTTLRRAVARVGLKGLPRDALAAAARAWSRDVLPGFVRPVALERIRWHQARGDTVVVVSASLDLYLRDWCQREGLEVLCSQLGHRRGRLTGYYRGVDCGGDHKARRILKRYRLTDYRAIHAYGDSEEDEAMLALADHRVYRWEGFEVASASPRTARNGFSSR
ncbi:HAD-IB family phosphatase [Marilutibacter spongiae]|uniref:HAD-IB family phosphatase n=1 Tax=Marilutibacter spongiae TaxID=2025720 RepID=A0A7W3Y649_9GAMM|nr:HAD-IB family phosphatase [Lysobacter spongiae]MBB1061108.1 HAD-IB family phosphatase [Lysobacter spongiae]